QRRYRRIFVCALDEIRLTAGVADLVLRVVAGEGLGDKREVLHRPAINTERIERVGLQKDAPARDQPERRLEAADATERRWWDDGPGRLSGERRRQHAAGNGRSRARR